MELPVKYNGLDYKTKHIVKQAYTELQKGLCCHCKEPLIGRPSKAVSSLKINTKLFPENFFKYPVHLHHSHITGLTIGVAHCECNAVLWQYYGE